MDDVLVIGGSFAGLIAAMHLVRARRKVTILDTDRPRNRYAAAAHNVLGFDGTPPAEIRRKGLDNVLAYPTARHAVDEAVSIEGAADNFVVRTASGANYAARRLILSYGVRDVFPDIPGFEACWGKTVIHCPYCHGYEVAGGRLGLLYSNPNSLYATVLLRDWSDRLTLLTNDLDLPPEQEAKLTARGVGLREGRVVEIVHEGGMMRAVRFASGEELPLDAMLAHPDVQPAARLHEHLGIATEHALLGPYLRVNDEYQTSVPGVFGAGDLAGPRHSINGALHGGMLAAVGCHRSLLD